MGIYSGYIVVLELVNNDPCYIPVLNCGYVTVKSLLFSMVLTSYIGIKKICVINK